MNTTRNNNIIEAPPDIPVILYVGNEPADLNAIKSLYKGNINILTANSGKGGLKTLERQAVQLVIAAQRMPDMTGAEFFKKVRNKWAGLRYILLAEYQDNEIIKEVDVDVAIYWYTSKSFDDEKVLHIVKKEIKAYKSDHLQRKSEEKYKNAFNSMADVFTRSDMDGICVMVSPSIYNMIGYKPEEIIGKNLEDFYANPKQRSKIVDKLQNTKTVENFEIDAVRKDGKVITVSTNAKMYYDDNGEPLGVEGNFRDISEQKKAEVKVLEYQQRLKELAIELTISEEKVRKQIAVDLHDNVGQLLTSSRMQLARVLDLEENPEVEIRIKNISQALLKSIQATREAIFNLSPPELNEIGLFAAVHDWIHVQIEQKYDISTTIAGEEARYQLGENTRFLIFRSIKELIMNVLKHARAKHLQVEFLTTNEYLEISVEDDGVGFNYNTDLLRLKSNSYGLFSIQERMSDLGGSMLIDSVSDQGTKATLVIPRKNDLS